MTTFSTLFNALPNVTWDRAALSSNNGLTADIFESLDPSHPDWNYNELSRCLPLDYILSHPEKPWNPEAQANNFNVSPQYAADHPETEWPWNVLTAIHWRQIQDHPEYSWDCHALSMSGGITGINRESQGQAVRTLVPVKPDSAWSWENLSQWVPFDVVIDNPERPWDWAVLATRGTEDQVPGLGVSWSTNDWLVGDNFPSTLI